MMDGRFPINRREFLKLARLLFLSTALPGGFLAPPDRQGDKKTPNFLIIVFDALSAMNMSLYDYPRPTTPNIDRIAERATVYHNHYAAGHWTYPGTASLLTGVLPWSHRGLWVDDLIVPPYDKHNIFGLLEKHHRLAYTHNPAADLLLLQCKQLMQDYQERDSLLLNDFSLTDPSFLDAFFGRDYDVALVGWIRYTAKVGDGYSNSLFLSNISKYLTPAIGSKYEQTFPNGPPRFEPADYFFLEDAINAIIRTTLQSTRPYLAYYHLLPPHAPYENTRVEFINRFKNDRYHPVEKEKHFLSDGIGQAKLNNARRNYDEYILYADSEFGRLIDAMEANGSLDNTWVILTSDHGEMFERGIPDHRHPVFYQAVARVPLMILPPRQTARQDIYAPTSAVDLLPTLLHLSGEPIPEILEGDVLPPFSVRSRDESQAIFAMDARTNDQFRPLEKTTIMLRKGTYKLTYYLGYDQLPGGEPYFELYDLAEDPEELRNLYHEHPRQASQMADELLQKLEEKNKPYA